jgi:hypothetical protein
VGVLAYGIKFSCDLCGAQADGAPVAGDLVYGDLPVPDGWTGTDLIEISLRDVFQAPVRFLCPACSALTIGQIAQRMKERLRETVASAGGK